MKEEDVEGDGEVHEMEDQGEVRPDTTSEAKEEGVARRMRLGGFNEDDKPVSKAGEILEAGEDYVNEEYTNAIPQRRQRVLGYR
uniref:Uncharacterized protein n=1 Tax=Cannabis sativa TaxID=3483 RepID=A0A803Q7Z3_CANSA